MKRKIHYDDPMGIGRFKSTIKYGRRASITHQLEVLINRNTKTTVSVDLEMMTNDELELLEKVKDNSKMNIVTLPPQSHYKLVID